METNIRRASTEDLFIYATDHTSVPPRERRQPFDPDRLNSESEVYISSGLGGVFKLHYQGKEGGDYVFCVINPGFEDIIIRVADSVDA